MTPRTIRSCFACLALVLVPLAPAALAQDPPAMVRVLQVRTQLGHQPQYESTIPKLWDAFKKAGFSTPISVSAGVSEPGLYTFVAPLSKLADLDTQNEQANKAYAAATAVLAELQEMTVSQENSLWALRPDLGYVPATPRVSPEEAAFTRLVFAYPHPARVLEFEGFLKESAALRKKHGLDDAVNVGQLMFGGDGPAFALLINAKSEADFVASNDKAVQKMGAEWQALLAKGGPTLRRVEIRSSAARPALGYQP